MTSTQCCPQCGHSIQDGAKFCSECGYTIEQSTSVAITSQDKQQIAIPQQEIKTIQDMESFIEGLSERANESAEAALKAQLAVIRYVQSPALYDSSFDMFFKNALKYADSPRMEEMIRERATIMIQNYVFFMNAKLQFEIAVNQEEQRELMEEACTMLAESVAEVARMAMEGEDGGDGGNIEIMALKAAAKMVTAKDSKGNSFLTKLWRLCTQDSRTKQKEGEFLQTIDKLTAKLYKQRDVIGHSDLIAGLIERYAADMTDYFYGGQVQSSQAALSSAAEQAKKYCRNWGWVILALSVVVLIIRWIGRGFSSAASWVSSKIADTDTGYVSDNSHWALQQWGYALGLFALICLIILIRYLIQRKNFRSVLMVARNEYDQAYRNYLNIAAEFEE